MNVHVQKPSGAPPCILEMQCCAILGDLRARLCEEESCEACFLQLLLNDKSLDCFSDETRLTACGIFHGVTLTLVKTIVPIIFTWGDHCVKKWNGFTGKCLQVLSGHQGYVRCIHISTDRSTILTCSDDDTAKIWDSNTGVCKQTLRGHSTGRGHSINSAFFSADGSMAVTSSTDETAMIWDCATGKDKHILKHHDVVNSAVFSPDGSTVLTASLDETAQIS